MLIYSMFLLSYGFSVEGVRPRYLGCCRGIDFGVEGAGPRYLGCCPGIDFTVEGVGTRYLGCCPGIGHASFFCMKQVVLVFKMGKQYTTKGHSGEMGVRSIQLMEGIWTLHDRCVYKKTPKFLQE